MMEEVDSLGDHKTNFLNLFIGFVISAIIVVVFYYLRSSPFLGGIFYIFDFRWAYYLIMGIYLALPFMINFIVIRSFKNIDIKKGLKIGFIIILLFTIYIIYLFISPILSNYYEQKALSTSDSDLCAKVKDVMGRNDCYKTIALRNNDSSLCDKMQGGDGTNGLNYLDFNKDECYSSMGYIKKDSSYCDKLSTPSSRDDCFNTFGISTKNLTVCDRIQSQEKKDNCYNWVAKNIRDPSFFATTCPLIKTQESSDDCYLMYAAYSKDWALCSNIKSYGVKSCCERKDDCVHV